MIIEFLSYLSWVVFPPSLLLFLGSTYATIMYKGSLDEIRDKIRGVRGVWPVKSSLIACLLSGVYLLTYYNQ